VQDISEHTKNILDLSSVITVLGTLAQILPGIAALWTIVWTSIRIYETKTVQNWLKAIKNAKQI
jgi:chromate transport protein ChrA